MDSAQTVGEKKHLPAKPFLYPFRLKIFCFEVMIIAIQKITVLFVDCARSCMLHCSHLVKEFVVSVSNVNEVTRIAYSCFFLFGHQNSRNQMLTNAA